MTLDQKHWAERLSLLADKHGVPGASLAILADGDVADAAYGVLNVRTGVEATPDSVFQIGSITKVWTATLVMQLVDEGRIDLDEPVVTYLPEFQVADAEVTRTVTTLLPWASSSPAWSRTMPILRTIRLRSELVMSATSRMSAVSTGEDAGSSIED